MMNFTDGDMMPIPIPTNSDDIRTAKSFARAMKIRIARMIKDLEKIESNIEDAEKRFSEDET